MCGMGGRCRTWNEKWNDYRYYADFKGSIITFGSYTDLCLLADRIAPERIRPYGFVFEGKTCLIG